MIDFETTRQMIGTPRTRVRALVLAASCLLALCSAPTASAIPATTPSNSYVTNGTVSAVTPSGGTLYIGGSFSEIGPRTGPFASVSNTTGALNPITAQLTGTVYASAPDGSGGYYLGGLFSVVGSTIANAVHVKSDGTLDSVWNPNPSGPVYAIAVSGSTVYLGGAFGSVTNSTGTGVAMRTNAAAVDTVHGRDTGWDPSPSAGGVVTSRIHPFGTSPSSGVGVYTLVVSGSTVYLGGNFSFVRANASGGVARNNAAAVDATSGFDTGWNPDPNGIVSALAVSGATVYLGGQFSAITNSGGSGTVPRSNAAAVNATQGFDTGWNPSPNGTVDALALSGSTVFLGGAFTSITDSTGTVSRSNAAAVDAGGVVTGWSPNPDAAVDALAVSGSTVYLGGAFGSITDSAGTGRATRPFAAAVDATSGNDSGWNPSPNGQVSALAVSGTHVYIGGGFTSITNSTGTGTVGRSNAAAVDATQGFDTGWHPSPNGPVSALAVSGANVYLGGVFSTVTNSTGTGTVARSNAAAVDGTQGFDTGWNPSPNGLVDALSIGNGNVYLGGSFNAITNASGSGTVTRHNAAAVDPIQGRDSGWNPNPNGQVSALAASSSTIFLGGAFSSVTNSAGSGQVTRPFAAAVDMINGRDDGWSPSPNGQLLGVAVAGTTLYVGGSFTSIGGDPQSDVAEFSNAQQLLSVSEPGSGAGSVTSAPSGISCGSTCSQSFDHGSSVTLTAVPAVGSRFAGWSGGGCSGTGTCTLTLNADTAVTATFIAQHVLTVSDAGSGTGSVASDVGGISCGAICSQSYDLGTMVTLTATPTPGSRFNGWSGGGCSGTGTCSVTLDADTSVIATFIRQHLLSASKAGAGSGSVTSDVGGISCGSTCSQSYDLGTGVTLTATASPGSTFAGWSGGGCSGTGTCSVTMNADASVSANFTTPLGLTVTKAGTGAGSVTSNPAGINCGVTCSQIFESGTPIALSAAPAVGSRFVGWSGGGCSGTGGCTVPMSSVTTVAATFAVLRTLAVTDTGSGAGDITTIPAGVDCGATCSQQFDSGSGITLIATPAAGSRFAGWSGGGCSGTGGCSLTLNADMTVTATFTAQHVLSVSDAGSGGGSVTSDVGGINCGSACSQAFDTGTGVTLTANPSPGSKFSGWSGGGCSGTGNCSVTLNAGTTVTATFDKLIAPRCTIRPASSNVLLAAPKKRKHTKVAPGTIAVNVRCDRTATVTLTGVITELVGKKPKHGKQRTKTYRLGPAHASPLPNANVSLTLQLPHAALADLKKKASMSVTLALSARGVDGVSTAGATIRSLKGV